MTWKVKAREGDFIETVEGLIFDVKGFLHPPDRVIAYLRYLPDGRGTRQRNGIKYRKVYDLDARAYLLARRWPHYLYRCPVFNREVQAVPLDNVKSHCIPTERYAELRQKADLDPQERLVIGMVETLTNQTGISSSKIGVSGSILVGLHAAESDIDLVLYGTEASRQTHARLKSLLETRSEGFSPCGASDLRKLYKQRSLASAISFETFVRHEQSKVLQGTFRGTQYFIRCVKEWDELHEEYGDRKYYPIGMATLSATIVDDSESIFTPSTYQILHVELTGGAAIKPPSQIVSFRGRFCEQALIGERILAKGTLEKVVEKRGETHRLVIGEDPRDFLTVVGKSE